MFKMLLALSVISTTPAYALTQIGFSCPEKYIATVIGVNDVASNQFPKVEVDLQVIQTLKGDEITSKRFQMVKDGPIQFKTGVVYTVEFNNGWLCNAAPLTHS